MEKEKILIIEANADTLRFLETMLSKEFEVFTAENGVLGIDYARNRRPHLILLDVILPILNGYDACSLLKKDDKTKKIPLIFLTAKNSATDIAQGFAVGADDYITKPFSYQELLARIKVRLKKNTPEISPPLHVGNLTIDSATREVTFNDVKAHLTLTEFDILRCLARKAGMVVSREEILKEVWKDDSQSANNRTIDVHIRALRRKMPALTQHILSIYGIGYKYEA